MNAFTNGEAQIQFPFTDSTYHELMDVIPLQVSLPWQTIQLIILSQLEDQGWHLEIVWLVVHVKKGKGPVHMILLIRSCYVYKIMYRSTLQGVSMYTI